MVDLHGKKIIITGGARRLGRQFALACAQAGASVIIHHGHSPEEAQKLVREIEDMGASAAILQANFSYPAEAITAFNQLLDSHSGWYALVNNAAIFEPVKFIDTSLDDWNKHMDINLTIPFLLSQAFARKIGSKQGRIINILDWRALRPGKDHFPYTISKAALAAMTNALANILAPNIQVNALALGAILPPSDGGSSDGIIQQVPAGRWADLNELNEALMFLLTGPDYITGEIIHLDGGRHLV
jgi:NAD(P)-dependent dehydrogenase (short-subunit alcohol dehydrogenase family)